MLVLIVSVGLKIVRCCIGLGRAGIALIGSFV